MIYNGYNRRLERWIINHQTGRRNLTKSQLVKAYASVEEQLKREAKERQVTAGKEYGNGGSKLESNLTQASKEKRNPQTDEIVAKKIGVSKNTYKGMKQIVTEGTPEQVARMDRGGKGNGVSAIVAEIKEEKASKDAVGEERPCGKFTAGFKEAGFGTVATENQRDIMSLGKLSPI